MDALSCTGLGGNRRRFDAFHPFSTPISLRKILSATENFDSIHQIGRGRCSTVYKGTIDGRVAAIKKYAPSCQPEHTEYEHFVNEGTLLCRLQHARIVRMFGYCVEGENRILVIEHMPRGSLYQKLFDNPSLSWKNRVRAAVEVAVTLQYLHEMHDPPIVHCDVRLHNILFNDTVGAKLANFGLSFELTPGVNLEHVPVRGTTGYVDPVHSFGGNVCIQNDVYSFGVVLLQLVSGLPATFQSLRGGLADYMVDQVAQGKGYYRDPTLAHVDKASLDSMMELVIACLAKDETRPKISDVLLRLNEIDMNC